MLSYIVSAYPSQSLYYERLHSLPPSFLPTQSPAEIWMSSLTSCLRSRNYIKFEELTRPTAFAHIIHEPKKISSLNPLLSPSGLDLARKAFYNIMSKLRAVSRETTWSVIRYTYRDLSLRAGDGTTRDWLSRSLALPSVIPGERDIPVEEWLQRKIGEGHARAKEGVEGKYIICKVR